MASSLGASSATRSPGAMPRAQHGGAPRDLVEQLGEGVGTLSVGCEVAQRGLVGVALQRTVQALGQVHLQAPGEVDWR